MRVARVLYRAVHDARLLAPQTPRERDPVAARRVRVLAETERAGVIPGSRIPLAFTSRRIPTYALRQTGTPVIIQRRAALRREVHERVPLALGVQVSPRRPAELRVARAAALEVPAHALGAPRPVDVAAERETGTHAPELPAQHLAARRRLVVAVRAGRAVRDQDVRVEGDRAPEGPRGGGGGGRVVGFRSRVLECPGAAAPGGAVRGSEDGERGPRARGRGQLYGAALVHEVSEGPGPREESLAVRWPLGRLEPSVCRVDVVVVVVEVSV